MKFRSLYVKLRVFLNTNSKLINMLTLTAMGLFTVMFLLNYVVFERIIMNAASSYALTNQNKKALNLYNISLLYYGIFHFNETNKYYYIQIPYSKAQCYLADGKPDKAVKSMLSGITYIQNEYGIFSSETALFMRKYLIEFYLQNNNIDAAKQEFDNLLNIYKSVRALPSEQADLVRLLGDFYYAKGDYNTSIEYYKRAYNLISRAPLPDYEVLVKIVERVARYETAYKYYDKAEDIYRNTINFVGGSTITNKKLQISLLLNLAELYIKEEKTKSAIETYEKSIAIIKQMPRTNHFKQNIDEYYKKLSSLYDADGQFHKVREIQQILDNRKRFDWLY